MGHHFYIDCLSPNHKNTNLENMRILSGATRENVFLRIVFRRHSTDVVRVSSPYLPQDPLVSYLIKE